MSTPCEPTPLDARPSAAASGPRLDGDEPGGTMGIELENPIPNDLKRHAADLRRFRAPRPVADRSQRRRPPCLAPSITLRSFAPLPRDSPARMVGSLVIRNPRRSQGRLSRSPLQWPEKACWTPDGWTCARAQLVNQQRPLRQTLLRRDGAKRFCLVRHCRQRYKRNLRRIHTSRFVRTRGVWQKPK